MATIVRCLFLSASSTKSLSPAYRQRPFSWLYTGKEVTCAGHWHMLSFDRSSNDNFLRQFTCKADSASSLKSNMLYSYFRNDHCCNKRTTKQAVSMAQCRFGDCAVTTAELTGNLPLFCSFATHFLLPRGQYSTWHIIVRLPPSSLKIILLIQQAAILSADGVTTAKNDVEVTSDQTIAAFVELTLELSLRAFVERIWLFDFESTFCAKCRSLYYKGDFPS